MHLALLACCGLSRLINILFGEMQVYARVHTSISISCYVCVLCVCTHSLIASCTLHNSNHTFYPSNSIFLRLKRMRRTIFHSARNLSFRVKLFNRLPSSFSTFQWHLMESVFPSLSLSLIVVVRAKRTLCR